MNSKFVEKLFGAGLLGILLSASCLVPSLRAQQSGATAKDALQKAYVDDRMAEGMAVEHKGTSPGFVVDPAWPLPLPYHWVIGDVGGIAVDKHDHIWVYHRPRSVGSTDSGIEGVEGAQPKGNPIIALGF